MKPLADWADLRAAELWPAAQLTPGNTVADGCRAIADALRRAEARGYLRARRLRLTDDEHTAHDERLMAYGLSLARNALAREVYSDRELRERRLDDCQRDHLQAIDEREPWVAS